MTVNVPDGSAVSLLVWLSNIWLCVCNNEFNITARRTSHLWCPLNDTSADGTWSGFLYYYYYCCYLTPFCCSPLSVTCELMLEIVSTCNQAHMIITQVIGFYFFHALLEIIFFFSGSHYKDFMEKFHCMSAFNVTQILL